MIPSLQLEVPVIGSTSPREALQLLLEHDIVLCILDVQMPEMNGFELAEIIRNDPQFGHIPIIFLTAIFTAEEFRSRGWHQGQSITWLSRLTAKSY